MSMQFKPSALAATALVCKSNMKKVMNKFPDWTYVCGLGCSIESAWACARGASAGVLKFRAATEEPMERGGGGGGKMK